MSGSNNIASGFEAMYHNISGYNNIASGFEPMWENVSGYENIAIGWEALFDNISGYENIAIGSFSLYSNNNGQGNTAVGWGALGQNGQSADDGGYVGGDYNTAVGTFALPHVGYQSGHFGEGGTNNIGLGWGAGSGLENGNNNIYIGTSQSGEFVNGEIRIGDSGLNYGGTYIAGIYNQVVANSALPVYVNFSDGKLGTVASSARFKQDIHSMEDASDVLLSLRPVMFHYKPEFDPHGAAQFGLVAEEVDKVDPDLVVHDGKGEAYSVRYEAVNAMLLNEFLKQHRKVEEQNAEIQTLNQKLETRNQEQESRIQSESTEITELKQRLATLEQIILKQKSN
jgi:hypothetical protein